MTRSKSLTLLVSMFLLAMLSVSFASAQYMTEQTTPVTVPSGGVATVDQTATTGLSFEITAAAGATGSVTSTVYLENPQPTGNVPEGISLTNFVAVTFNMDAASFVQAKIVLHYTDSEVEGIPEPLAIYKYIPETNSFLLLPTQVDQTAKTLTATVNSPTDPLFAIGNAIASSASPTATIAPTASPVGGGGFPVWQVAAIIVVVVVAIVAVLFFFMRR